jgi:O-antigen ligase
MKFLSRLATMPAVSLPGLAILALIAAAFTLPTEPAYALVFYVTAVTALVFYVRGGRRFVWADPAIVLGFSLIVFSGLSVAWGIDDENRAGRFALDSVATLVFLVCMLAAFHMTVWRERVGLWLTAAGAANAAFAIVVAFATHPADPRLHGWGVTKHPILGASVMAVAYLSALFRFLRGGTERWLALAGVVLTAAFILMTESRGPLLAVVVATVFLCAAGPWRRWACAVLVAVAVGWWALPASVQQHGEAVLVHRGTSHRLEIWDYTLRMIGDRPLLGHGLAANLHLNVGEDITFPHDLYLSLLFYTGVVGLLLFAGFAGLLAWRLWLRRGRQETLWIAALGINALLSGLTDLGQITKGPGPIWFIVWLPLGLALGATLPLRDLARARKAVPRRARVA